MKVITTSTNFGQIAKHYQLLPRSCNYPTTTNLHTYYNNILSQFNISPQIYAVNYCSYNNIIAPNIMKLVMCNISHFLVIIIILYLILRWYYKFVLLTGNFIELLYYYTVEKKQKSRVCYLTYMRFKIIVMILSWMYLCNN